jgi:hypothetical protein
MNGSHALVAAVALMVGAAIPTLIRWTAMPLIIAGLVVILAAALVVLARRAGTR